MSGVPSERRWHVHFAGGERVKWALDEDLRHAREALGGDAVITGLPAARIVHFAWWLGVLTAGRAALEGKSVVCFADNPPSFYLTQPQFLSAARRVDLWVARTREAHAQFQTLGLPVARAPYCVDEEVFRPLPDRERLRAEIDLPRDAFVIGNFHRDSDGSNLALPKRQKGADVFLEIARRLHARLPRTMVLLAGPRRHWLRAKLAEAGVPCRFVGAVQDGDDYAVNILPRSRLNELYQALDVCVISSRWEGGPHSTLEALYAGRPVISTPVGISRDCLSGECLFQTVHEAVEHLSGHAAARSLDEPAGRARDVVVRANSRTALREKLLEVYAPLPRGGESLLRASRAAVCELAGRAAGMLRERREDYPPDDRANRVARMVQELQTRGAGEAIVVETPIGDGSDPASSWSQLRAAAQMCRGDREGRRQ